MKRLLLIALFSVACLTGFAQKVVEQLPTDAVSRSTTMEEFNYLTKGLKAQVEQGLDMKRGYVFKDTQTFEYGVWNVTIKDLIREKDNSLAGISVVLQKKGASSAIYYGLPNLPQSSADGAEIMQKAQAGFNNPNLLPDQQSAIIAALYLRAVSLADAKYSGNRL